MDFGGANLTLLVIIGPILLFAVLLWAFLRNRSARGNVAESERGTRRVYDESEAVRRSGDDGA